MSEALQDSAPSSRHSPKQERPLAGYAALIGSFVTIAAGFGAWLRASGRELPERMPPGDLALITVATHKASRLVAKDRVTSSVRAPFTRFEGDPGLGEDSEEARGSGLRRAIGELVTCPYCISLWIASALAAGLLVAPRATRWVASVLSAIFGSDLLQIAYKRAEDAL
jgi:Protein of unknown function (DUF1360)